MEIDLTSHSKEERREKCARIFSRLFGENWRAIVADALGIDRSAFRRYFTPPQGRDDAPPEPLLALAELLQAIPRQRWPDRWTQASKQDRMRT